MKKRELKAKVAIVAGWTGGIGFETCKLLARQNVAIILASRKNLGSKNKFNEIKDFSPSSIIAESDLSEWKNWVNLIKTSIKKFDRVDYLINCIGMITPMSFEKISVSDIEKNIKINLFSTIYGTKAVIPQMLKQKYGRIIIVGSLGGIVPMPHETIYSTSKFAVRGFCLSLAEELKNSGISVSLISTGPVKTKLLDKEAMDDKSTLAFVNKPIPPKEVAINILKLISNPQREIILPKSIKKISPVVSNYPRLFSLLYPILDVIGKYKQSKYKHNMYSALGNISSR